MRTSAFSLLSSCRCYTKQKLRDWYLLKDEMRTCAFSLSIFMSLLYKTRNQRLVVTQGRDAHLCLLAFYLHVLLLHNYKSKTGSCSGTCASGICYTHRDEMRTCAYSFLSSCRCYTKQKMRDWYLLRDEMRTCAFSFSIFMSLLYTTRNERLEVTQGRDVHLCLLAFYLHVVLIHKYK